MDSLVKVTIDGREVSVPRGTNLIEAAKAASVEVPHYCYHQKLSVAGNCRMCLVEVGTPKMTAEKKPELDAEGKPVISFIPKLQIACNTPVTEGMVCLTRSAKVEKARQGVMEFLLINHPLDCPICDQAGECRLQEFAVDFGKGESRFVDEKVHKPKKVSLGPKITLDTERCIMCSRCERFMREVAGQDCLGFTKRGSRVELTCYTDEWPNTNYDLNIVDICPVGALTSNDFRFRMRPWFLKETRSICPHCATGCNMVIGARNDVIYRQTPRDNDAVNGSWMCDYGRLKYKFIQDAARLQSPVVKGEAVSWNDALGYAAIGLAAHTGAVAVVGSARGTTEELFLLSKLASDVLSATACDCIPRSGEADGKLLVADRNPNMKGAQLVGVAATPPGGLIASIAAGIRAGSIRALVVHGEDVTRHGIGADLLQKLDLLVAIDVLPSDTTRAAHVVLPGTTFAEKRGTFINGKGRLQRINVAVQPKMRAYADWSILSSLINAMKPGTAPDSFDAVFAAMAETIPSFAGLTFSGIGDLGIQLDVTSPAGRVEEVRS